MFYTKAYDAKKIWHLKTFQILQGTVTNRMHPVYFNVLKFHLKMALI